MKHAETYVVDLNDVYEYRYLIASRRHTLEYGLGTRVDPLHDIGIQEGDHVRVFSDDEDTTWEALVIKELTSDTYAVDVFWDSGVRTALTQSIFGGATFVGGNSPSVGTAVDR